MRLSIEYSVSSDYDDRNIYNIALMVNVPENSKSKEATIVLIAKQEIVLKEWVVRTIGQDDAMQMQVSVR